MSNMRDQLRIDEPEDLIDPHDVEGFTYQCDYCGRVFISEVEIPLTGIADCGTCDNTGDVSEN